MSTIQHLLEKQRESAKNQTWFHRIDDIHEFDNTNDCLDFLSTMQQEILQAVKEKVEGMERHTTCDTEECKINIFPICRHAMGFNDALFEVSSWLEGEKK
jgi:hypothetical protein